MDDYVVAKHHFATSVGGGATYVHIGEIAHKDHPLVAARPDAWRPLRVKYDVERKAPPAASSKGRKGDGDE